MESIASAAPAISLVSRGQGVGVVANPFDSLALPNKKPRMVRGSERLATRLSELAGLVLAVQQGLHK
jgi:hypothetical protein